MGAGEAAQRVDAMREAQRGSPLRGSAARPKALAASGELKGLLDEGFGPASTAVTTKTMLDARSARGLSDYMSMGSVGPRGEPRRAQGAHAPGAPGDGVPRPEGDDGQRVAHGAALLAGGTCIAAVAA